MPTAQPLAEDLQFKKERTVEELDKRIHLTVIRQVAAPPWVGLGRTPRVLKRSLAAAIEGAQGRGPNLSQFTPRSKGGPGQLGPRPRRSSRRRAL